MEKTKKTGTLVECSILIAMAFVLSFIKIIDMPYGGAVTAASMLPIIIAGYRHGLKWGLITSFTYSILQLLTGLSNVSYATSTTAMIAIILLDYIVAFTVLVSNSIDLRAAKPVTREKSKNIMAVLNGVLVCGIAIIVDFLIIFRQIQTEDGFKITLITNTNWMLVGVILLVGVIVGGLTYVITKLVVSKKKTVLPRREN